MTGAAVSAGMAEVEIGRETAVTLYEQREGRDAMLESRLGLYLALDLAVTDEFVRRLHRLGRRRAGAPAPADRAMPAWVGEAYLEFMREVDEQDDFSGLLRPGMSRGALTSPGTRALVAELVLNGTVEKLSDMLEGSNNAPEVLPLVESLEAHHRRLKPRDRIELRAFFYGVRGHFHIRDLGEPTARDMALLACARGLEPIERGLNLARKHWDERIGRWRREIDAVVPDLFDRLVR